MKHQAVEELGRPPGQDGWYIGPALEHYRCYKAYINKTRSERIVETMPFPSTRYLVTQATKKLSHALLHPQPAGPFTQVGDDQMLALERSSAIFEGAFPKHRRSPTSPHMKTRHIKTSDLNTLMDVKN
jgi:hypothetical protein